MDEIIRWLQEVELLAGNIYEKAACCYPEDQVFTAFLTQLAEEEGWHNKMLESAKAYLSKTPDIQPAISLDTKLSSEIFNCLKEIDEGIEARTLSKSALLKNIVKAELSEWNDIFLYVVNVLKKRSSDFNYPVRRLQAHIKEIERYVREVEALPEIVDEIKALPPIWVENILIVDDDPIIQTLLKSLLNREGNIDLASNGKVALQLIEEKYYKLILSDITMPVMDGITLYKEACKKYSSISSRFLFITGHYSPQYSKYFQENNISYLFKPVLVKELRSKASRILLSP